MSSESAPNTGVEPPAAGFGERFATRMAAGLSCMALLLCFSSLVRASWAPFYAVMFCLVLSHWFRRRSARDEKRRNEVMEDERDAAIVARSERVFRYFASSWFVALALAICIDATRSLVPQHVYALPSLLLLGILGANIAAHLSAAISYRRDRRAQ